MQKDLEPLVFKNTKRERKEKKRWTDEEFEQLFKAIETHGKDFKLLA